MALILPPLRDLSPALRVDLQAPEIVEHGRYAGLKDLYALLGEPRVTCAGVRERAHRPVREPQDRDEIVAARNGTVRLGRRQSLHTGDRRAGQVAQEVHEVAALPQQAAASLGRIVE